MATRISYLKKKKYTFKAVVMAIVWVIVFIILGTVSAHILHLYLHWIWGWSKS